MARFVDEPAGDDAAENWSRIQQLCARGKTVEVYQRRIKRERKLFLRIWTGKRSDGSNKVGADPTIEY